eukprot:gene14206-21786_t
MVAQVVKLAIVGFGAVGQAFAQMLVDKQRELEESEGVRFAVHCVATKTRGCALSEAPLDLRALLRAGPDGRLAGDMPHAEGPAGLVALLGKAPYHIDIVIECVPVDYTAGEPALSILKSALLNGMHAVSANKGPVVHGCKQLQAIAAEHGKRYLFESAVMDGVPIFNMARHCLRGANITGFK